MMTSPEPIGTMVAPLVVCDKQRRTALVVDFGAGVVHYIPLSIENGFNVDQMPEKEFRGLYEQLTDYPPSRCASLYVQYAMTVGASEEALEHLGRITTVKLSQKEIEMATAKKTAAGKADTAKTAAKKGAAAKPAAKKAPAEKKEPGERKPSAASMFKELIMAGGKTDDQIFAAVQKKFGLDDNKRSYVAWYRKDLEKKGEKPPAPVVK